MAAVGREETPLVSLLRSAREGDPAASERLWRLLFKMTWRCCRKHYRDRQDHEDLRQETAARLLGRIPLLLRRVDLTLPDRAIHAFMNRMVYRCFLDARARHLRLDQKEQLLDFEWWDEIHAHYQPRPDQLAATSEMRKLAHDELYRSVHGFRFREYRVEYLHLVTRWLRHGLELTDHMRGLPQIVQDAALYRLRRTSRTWLVRNYGAAS